MTQRTAVYCTLLLAATFVAAGCSRYRVNKLPPAKQLLEPGPGVGGPGPGVMLGDMPMPLPIRVSQLAFINPAGMWISWDTSGRGTFDSQPLVVPARQDFTQGAIYRLKLTNIPARPGVELYPSIEIGPTTPRTEAYLSHNAIPITLTEEDLNQVLSGNFVSKVIYLPDPEFQELALAGIEELVSTRLDPGVDPIAEADRRGSILAILRIGNIDPEMPGAAGPMAGGFVGAGGVMPVSYFAPIGPGGGPAPHATMGLSPSHVAGITAPQYGMPMSGTPIGLPGPPHVPLGVPAGLRSHSIKNHTNVNMPHPTRHLNIHVKQKPGLSYPTPPSRVHISEANRSASNGAWHQPLTSKLRWFH